MKIVMIGSGNVATILSKLIMRCGHKIVQVISRNRDHAELLAKPLNAASGLLTDDLFLEADLYIIALNDAVLADIYHVKALKHKMIVHTAGSVSIDVLKDISTSYGILYPLQTLSKFTEHLPEIPFLIDGNNVATKEFIQSFAKSLSDNVSFADDSERMKYHVSAVFVSNFTNHILTLAESYCDKESINFKNLLPLLDEVIFKAKKYSALESQTGPALRGDNTTIDRHLHLLSSHPEMEKVYGFLSESIMYLSKEKRD